MQAIIMAGGKGTRLSPLTITTPKPMLPINNKPIMHYIVDLLHKHDIHDIVAALAYLPEQVMKYFGNHLKYSIEPAPLGTAGSIKLAYTKFDNPTDSTLVISGDCLTNIDLTAALDYHRLKNAAATLVLTKHSNPLEFGVVVADSIGRVTRFLEKPDWDEVFTNTVNTGIYILSPEVFARIPANTPLDFSHDVFPAMLNEPDTPLYAYTAPETVYWRDVGSPAALISANRDFGNSDAIIHPTASIHPSANIDNSAIIWENSTIDKNVKIGKNVIVADNVHVGANAVIESNVIVSSDTIIPPNTSVNDTFTSDIFGENSVYGKPNLEITPEVASRLGSSFASLFPKADIAIGLGRSSILSDTMLAYSFMAGVASVGNRATNFGVLPLPRLRGLGPAAYIRDTHIYFLNQTGTYLSKTHRRTLKQHFLLNEFVRNENIGRISTIKREQRWVNIPVDLPFNVIVDPNGEQVVLYDERSRKVTDEQWLYLSAKLADSPTLVAPPYAPVAIQGLGHLIYSKPDIADFQAELIRQGAFKQFELLFNAEIAIKMLNDYLISHRTTLANLLDTLPLMHFAKTEIAVPNAQKGEIMHNIFSSNNSNKIRTAQGWVMVMPHKVKPIVKVVAEGVNAEVAEELCNEVKRKIMNK